MDKVIKAVKDNSTVLMLAGTATVGAVIYSNWDPSWHQRDIVDDTKEAKKDDEQRALTELKNQESKENDPQAILANDSVRDLFQNTDEGPNLQDKTEERKSQIQTNTDPGPDPDIFSFGPTSTVQDNAKNQRLTLISTQLNSIKTQFEGSIKTQSQPNLDAKTKQKGLDEILNKLEDDVHCQDIEQMQEIVDEIAVIADATQVKGIVDLYTDKFHNTIKNAIEEKVWNNLDENYALKIESIAKLINSLEQISDKSNNVSDELKQQLVEAIPEKYQDDLVDYMEGKTENFDINGETKNFVASGNFNQGLNFEQSVVGNLLPQEVVNKTEQQQDVKVTGDKNQAEASDGEFE